MLTIHFQACDHSEQLTCTGRLVRGDECELLKQAVLGRAEASVVLDLSQIEFADAAGLGTLAFLHNQLLAQGRKLTLLSPPQNLLDLIRLTGLDQVLTMHFALECCAA